MFNMLIRKADILQSDWDKMEEEPCGLKRLGDTSLKWRVSATVMCSLAFRALSVVRGTSVTFLYACCLYYKTGS